MRRILVGTAALLMFLAGCSEPRPSADVWVASVCGALAPWRAAITDLNQSAGMQITQTSTVEQTRANLVDLVADSREATEAARAAVAAAGLPDVPGGEEVARRFEEVLVKTRDAYAAAESDLLALPGDDETAFYDGVIAVMGRLSDEYERAGAELSNLDSPELRAAFDRAPECR